MPPSTTSTWRSSTSFAATASATASSVALSSMNSSTGRPSRPPRAFRSSITMVATLALATPMNDNGPDRSVTTPTRAGRLLVVMTEPLGLVRADEVRGHRLGEVAGVLQDRGHLGVGDEVLPALLVPVEDGPHAVVLAGVAEHRRTLRAVHRTLLSALLAEHPQELVDIGDGRRDEDHLGSPSDRWP